MTMHQWAEKFEDENYTHIARDVIGLSTAAEN